MLKAYKFRLDPNLQQKIQINKTLGCCRFLYNQMLLERKENYEIQKIIETMNLMNGGSYKKVFEKNRTEKQYKEKFEFLKEVDSVALQQSRMDLETSYKNFFRKVKIGNKTDLKFKSKKNSKNSYRSQIINNNIEVKDNKIKIPKMGFVKFKKSREVVGEIRNITVSKTKTGKYFISILCELEIKNKISVNKNIGIDLGLKTFVVTSDGEYFDNPKYLRNSENKLKKVQRTLSRKIQKKLNIKEKVEGKNIEKNRIKLCRIYEKISNQRTDFLQKLSTKIINENQIICLEDLRVSNMVKNHKLAKSISDSSWASFVQMLNYKADWYGRTIIKIGTFFPSSKLCSQCGLKKEELGLWERVFDCECGLEIDRDLNASLNILKQGLKILEDKQARDLPMSLVNTFSLEKVSQESL